MIRIDGRLIVMFTVIFVLLSSHLAHGQSSGYSVSPDGSITSWDANGGYSSGPSATSSWDSQGGYSADQGASSSWSGPALPVVPTQPGEIQQFVIQPDPDPLLP